MRIIGTMIRKGCFIQYLVEQENLLGVEISNQGCDFPNLIALSSIHILTRTAIDFFTKDARALNQMLIVLANTQSGKKKSTPRILSFLLTKILRVGLPIL